MLQHQCWRKVLWSWLQKINSQAFLSQNLCNIKTSLGKLYEGKHSSLFCFNTSSKKSLITLTLSQIDSPADNVICTFSLSLSLFIFLNTFQCLDTHARKKVFLNCFLNTFLLFLPPGVNFTNILWAAFAPKSFRQKITNLNCKHIKAAPKTFVW